MLNFSNSKSSLRALQRNAWQSTTKNATENIDCHDSANADSRNDGNVKSFNHAHPQTANGVYNKTLNLSQVTLFLMFYVFFFVLNALFPAQSDDLGAGIGTIESIKHSYLHWNARLGELAKVAFGSYLAHTPYFAFINAFFDVALLYLLFVLVFGRLPQNQNVANVANLANTAFSSEQNSKMDSSDVAILCFMLIAFMLYRAFGAVFLWGGWES